MKRTVLFSALLYALLTLLPLGAGAQNPYENSKSLDATETLRYDLAFRWTIVRGKVGEARLINKPANKNQYFSQLIFRTTGIGDNVFPMRDTLETLFSAQKRPIRFEKRINENKFRLNDVISYVYSAQRTALKVKQWNEDGVRIDTTLYLESGAVVADMLSTIALVRSVDYRTMKVGHKYAFVSPSDDKLVGANYRLTGYGTAKIGGSETVNVLKIAVQVRDDAFEKGGNAMEVWLTRDDRLLPVFISARLNFGYAECTLTGFSRN